MTALLGTLGRVAPVRAQTTAYLPPPRVPSTYQAFYVATNLGIHLSLATVRALLLHTSLPRAVAAGVVGGAGGYTGMRILGTGRPALRFVGLQTVAATASVERNITRGRAWNDEWTIPLYPLVMTVRPSASPDRARLQVQLSGTTAAATVYALTQRRWHPRIDWKATALAGSLVVRAQDQTTITWRPRSSSCVPPACYSPELYGTTIGGLATYATASPDPAHVLTHELEHVAQFTRELIPAGQPISSALWSLGGHRGRRIGEWVLLDTGEPIHVVNGILGPSAARLPTWYLELEVEGMTGRMSCAQNGYRCRW